MIDFAKVQGVEIPEGKAIKITSGGLALWESLRKIEYIRSNGFQYIDTGIVPDNATKVEIDAILSKDTQIPSALMGATDSDNSKFELKYEGEDFRTTYGQQNGFVISPVDVFKRIKYIKDRQETIIADRFTSVSEEDFIVKDTLKLFASSFQPKLSYNWYKNGNLLEKSVENTLQFLGNKEEEGDFWCIVKNGDVEAVSNVCTVRVEDDSLLSGAKYTHNATEEDWYYNNNGDNLFDYDGTYLTDGNIYNDFWQDKYFGVQGINPVIEFYLDKPITFKELQIFVVEGKAGILPPSKVTIEYKPKGDEEWIAIYDDKCADNDLILVSPTELTAEAFKFSFIKNGAFCFIDEIRAFPSYTGRVPDGILQKVEPNRNILLGLPYIHNVTNWYQGAPRDDGTALTDGDIYGSYYGTDYLNAEQKRVTVSFDFGEVKKISEIYIKAFEDINSGVRLPFVTVVAEDENGDKKAIFEGDITSTDFRLVALTPFEVKKLDFCFVGTRYVFIKEIEAYSRATGEEKTAEMKEIALSIIRGMLPDTQSVLPQKFAYKSSTDFAVLTDGVKSDDSKTYTNNITYSDDVVSFVYDVNKPFKIVRIYSHNPYDLAVKGIGEIQLDVYVDGMWQTVTIDDIGTNGVYEFVSNEPIECEKIKITITENVNGTGWSGVSLSEIEVFEDIPEIQTVNAPLMYAIRPKTVEESIPDGTSVKIVKDIPSNKAVSVGENFALSVVGITETQDVNNFAKMQVYACKIWQNDTLVRDFVPMVNGKGVAGLYDNITKRFFKGTENFEYE